MLSEYGRTTGVSSIDGRYDDTREARADARFPARLDARAVYVCRQRGALELIEPPAAMGYVAATGRARRPGPRPRR